jgi:hypothetical protein
MTYRLFSYLCASLFMMSACGPGSGGDDAIPALPDRDGDFIADVHEGCAEALDWDGDGILNCDDDDSDNDGIPDSVEAGDQDTNTPPVDSDNDGDPDFTDLDADNNGILDASEGGNDADGDGIPDSSDLDNDDDGLTDDFEIGPNPATPIDFDGDGIPDLWDTDSDNDRIADLHDRSDDPDADGIPSFHDLDSDEDCISDQNEAGDADINTPPADVDGDGRPNFKDLDSDFDGLPDRDEDLNCNGVLDPGESSAYNPDTDGDGIPDLVEVAAGTDPQDQNDNPTNNGDFVFEVPYEMPPSPAEDQLDFSTNLQIVDVYVLVDRSGSMSGEIASIRSNIQTVADSVTCPPLGNGDPSDCIPDIWWGVGTVGYRGSGGQPYTNHLDLQSNPLLITSSLPTDEPTSGCCDEPLLLGAYSTVSGAGSSGDGSCSVTTAYSARATCAGSPADQAGVGGVGYPCFRNNALPVVLWTTDEAPTTTYNCPSIANTAAAANAVGAKIVGVRGATTATQVTTDLSNMATMTGAVDASNGNAPLVVSGADGNAANAISQAIRTLANGVPLDISATPVDDPADAVDAVTAFIDTLEPLQLGTPECANGLSEADTNGDGYQDYVDVLPGTPVCWNLIPKMNVSVPPTDQVQLYTATIQVKGDNVTLLDTRDVFFLIPPVINEPPIE